MTPHNIDMEIMKQYKREKLIIAGKIAEDMNVDYKEVHRVMDLVDKGNYNLRQLK